MADIVTSQVIADTAGLKYIIKMTNISDGTGETQVTKVDASGTNFMTEDGNRVISKIGFSVQTASPNGAIELLWGGSSGNQTALVLSGLGFFDLRPFGAEIPNNATNPTGDVLLSTRNFSRNDSYTVLIEFR